jgi:hypothetical protein
MPQTQNLPGIEGGIPELESAAESYADIRDRRIALNVEEAQLKAAVLRLMHEHKKTVYQRGDVTITLVAEEETVKVKVRKARATDDDDDEAQTEADNVADFNAAVRRAVEDKVEGNA